MTYSLAMRQQRNCFFWKKEENKKLNDEFFESTSFSKTVSFFADYIQQFSLNVSIFFVPLSIKNFDKVGKICKYFIFFIFIKLHSFEINNQMAELILTFMCECMISLHDINTLDARIRSRTQQDFIPFNAGNIEVWKYDRNLYSSCPVFLSSSLFSRW